MLFLAFAILWCGSINVFAMNTKFSTEKVDADVRERVLANINLTLITEEPPKNDIECFDVNSKGLIAVGSGDWEEKTICVYDSAGAFQYGYSFHSSGSFGVEWDGGNLMIHFVRSDISASFDAAGVNIELGRIQNTIDNNSYWRDCLYSTQRTVGETRYTIKNSMGIFNIFSSSYSQLIKIDAEGNETTIYDVSAEHTVRTITYFVLTLLFITIVIMMLIRTIIRLQRHT